MLRRGGWSNWGGWGRFFGLGNWAHIGRGEEGGKRVLRVGGVLGDVAGKFWRGGGGSEGTVGPGEGSKGQH